MRVAGEARRRERQGHLPTQPDRLSMPITLIQGAENQVWTLEATRDDVRRAGRAVRPDELAATRHVIPGYGHLDTVFGKDAVHDTYPKMLDHLNRADAVGDRHGAPTSGRSSPSRVRRSHRARSPPELSRPRSRSTGSGAGTTRSAGSSTSWVKASRVRSLRSVRSSRPGGACRTPVPAARSGRGTSSLAPEPVERNAEEGRHRGR